MKETINRNNPYGDDKVMAACSLFGVMDTSGKRFSGEEAIRAITIMHERSNGLGGGFAVYGLYPEYRDYYALHVMYEHPQAQHEWRGLCLLQREGFGGVEGDGVPGGHSSLHPDGEIPGQPLDGPGALSHQYPG